MKKAWHYAIYFNDFSLAEKLNVDLLQLKDINDIREKYISSKKIIKNCVKRESDGHRNSIAELRQMESLNRLQSLQSLNRLQSLQSLQSFSLSYDEVKIDKNSEIYCDIPYHNTNAYGAKNINNFDYERFYNWCERQVEPLFISEYWMPEDRFTCIDEIEKTVLISSGADKKAVEKLFIPKHQKYDKWHGTLFEGFFS